MSGSTTDAPVTMRQQLLALLALTMVSTCIGFTMKKSQFSGRGYRYSPASAVVMTELYKLVASLMMIVRLVLAGAGREGGGAALARKSGGSEMAEAAVEVGEGGASRGGGGVRALFAEFTAFWRENMCLGVALHLLGLAFAYSIVNLVTFAIFLAAPASTFFLMKAGSPVLTALLLRFLVNRSITSVQWIAVTMQCVGLVVTQYNPCTRTGTLTTLGYLLIAINITVGCGCGVWNDQVIKVYGRSVNAQNVVLYSFGVVINLLVFLLVPGTFFGMKQSDAENVGFFDGYNWMVIAVIVANGSVGLVITAVYKYADVVVKTFGLAGSTVFLFVLEAVGLLPESSSQVSAMATVAGAVVVFYAAYLYIAPARHTDAGGKGTFGVMVWHQDSRVAAMLVLGVGATFTVLISSNSCDVALK